VEDRVEARAARHAEGRHRHRRRHSQTARTRVARTLAARRAAGRKAPAAAEHMVAWRSSARPERTSPQSRDRTSAQRRAAPLPTGVDRQEHRASSHHPRWRTHRRGASPNWRARRGALQTACAARRRSAGHPPHSPVAHAAESAAAPAAARWGGRGSSEAGRRDHSRRGPGFPMGRARPDHPLWRFGRRAAHPVAPGEARDVPRPTYKSSSLELRNPCCYLDILSVISVAQQDLLLALTTSLSPDNLWRQASS
jgi:hypothetical protein